MSVATAAAGQGVGGWLALSGRAVVRVGGPERVEFLNGLISADCRGLTPDRALYGLMLTAQGRFQHEFFLIDHNDAILIETSATRAEALARALLRYRLRAKVEIEPLPGEAYRVVVAFGAGVWAAGACAGLGLPEQAGAARPFAGGVALTDCRLPTLGARVLLPAGSDPGRVGAATGLAPASAESWTRWRLILGVPDGEADLIQDKSSPLEFNFDRLNAIAFDKGCFLGQEPTTRGHFRGLVRKRLLPATVTGPSPEPGTPVMSGARAVGEVRSGAGDLALALLRLEEIAPAAAGRPALTAGAAILTPYWPAWLVPARPGD